MKVRRIVIFAGLHVSIVAGPFLCDVAPARHEVGYFDLQLLDLFYMGDMAMSIDEFNYPNITYKTKSQLRESSKPVCLRGLLTRQSQVGELSELLLSMVRRLF